MENFRIRLVFEDQPDPDRVIDGRPMYLPIFEHVFCYPESKQDGINRYGDLQRAGEAELKRPQPERPA